MAEGTYEYECMRAELLGLDKPDYEEFIRNKQAEDERKEAEEEEQDVDIIKDVDNEEEGLTRVTGRLEELNSILKRTQTKINRFKVSCGSFTTSIKEKVGGRWSSQSSIDPANGNGEEKSIEETQKPQEEPVDENEHKVPLENLQANDPTKSSRKSDLTKAMDKNLSKLDSMIDQAENAQYSMSHQNKQMKKVLK